MSYRTAGPQRREIGGLASQGRACAADFELPVRPAGDISGCRHGIALRSGKMPLLRSGRRRFGLPPRAYNMQGNADFADDDYSWDAPSASLPARVAPARQTRVSTLLLTDRVEPSIKAVWTIPGW